VRRAGRIADGYLGSSTRRTGDSLEEVVRRVELANEGLAKAGRDPSDFTFAFHEQTWVAEDPEADFPKIVDHIHQTRWKYADMGAEFARKAGPLPRAPDLDDEAREAIKDSIILGTPEQVAERFRQMKEAAGVDLHIIARSYFVGAPQEMTLRCIELLGETKKLL
jgi:alkanesulfonate monooxygenase SsuD/methylene tetrahydromethanopterin reductase-like flavin-dependent oxidoreductase (luciferase family)